MSETQEKCHYQVHDSGVHEIVLYDFSRAGVDAFVRTIQQMAASQPSGNWQPVMVDSSRGMLPISYAVSQFRQASIQHLSRPTKMAILITPGIMMNVLNGVSQMYPRLNLRFFKPADRAAALNWLTVI